MPRTAISDRFCIYAASFLRSVCVGMTGVLIALYLYSVGWDVRRTGLLVSVGLAGSAVATLLTSFGADRFGRRRTLVLLGLLNAGGGLALLWAQSADILLVAAFFGMINGLGRDRGPAYALDQALVAETVPPERRTFALAWYSLILDAALALGSLLAGLPFLLRHQWGWASSASYQAVWVVYTVLALISAGIYALVSARVEVLADLPAGGGWSHQRVAPESRSRIAKLALLTGMDSLGGGFLTGALVSFWFFRRFGIGEEVLGPLYAGARVANAISHLVAAWLARRIGLLNTMVFTHIPSSLFLMSVPFAPTFAWAVVLFLLREGLVEMDVPTRQSYILAVVRPEERSFASGITILTRNIAYALAPALAGAAMRTLAMASPLFIGGGIKIVYDLLLYTSFRRVKPPEESASA